MSLSAAYPAVRPRRLRQADWTRRLVRENRLGADDLIWSVVVHDKKGDEPVGAMPGVSRLSVDGAAEAARTARKLGIPAIAIFPHIDGALKDNAGTEATNPNGLVCRVIRAMKDAAPEVGIMDEVALDTFTDHGHDGVLKDGVILNDESVKRLVDQAMVQTEAGADIIAPSDMLDGRFGAIGVALEDAGKTDTLLMSYAGKYASAFYGRYRVALCSAKALKGDKKTYQMDFGNGEEALKECALDVAEGADMLLVKPGLPYLDIVWRVKEAFKLPTFAFQISGEYSMIKAAAANGWIEEDRAILETLGAFKRAGADGVVTYFAPRAAELLRG